jgi:hypothetical protein
VSGQISDIKPAGQIVEEIIAEYRAVIADAQNGNSRFAF